MVSVNRSSTGDLSVGSILLKWLKFSRSQRYVIAGQFSPGGVAGSYRPPDYRRRLGGAGLCGVFVPSWCGWSGPEASPGASRSRLGDNRSILEADL